MPVLTLSLGSNIDAADNIRAALKTLRDRFGKVRCSTVYESEAIGFDGDNFLNLVALVETDACLEELTSFLKGLEDRLGRDSSRPRFSGRTMDIDILTYGEETGEACGTPLPRPEISKYAFVLRPLAEMLPDTIHPPTGLSYARLWAEFDQSGQKLWPVDFDW